MFAFYADGEVFSARFEAVGGELCQGFGGEVIRRGRGLAPLWIAWVTLNVLQQRIAPRGARFCVRSEAMTSMGFGLPWSARADARRALDQNAIAPD